MKDINSSILTCKTSSMKNSSFECLRSINNQLHNKLSQENQYQSYLKRIDKIVERKPFRDTSPEFYMNFLHKCKIVSKQHKDSQEVIKVSYENKNLLNKIMQARDKKMQPPSQSYHLNMHEKRNREIEKINDENLQIAKRITEQYSNLRRSLYKDLNKTDKRSSQKKTNYACWNYSPLKERKLPKLVNSPRKDELQDSTYASSVL